MEGFLTLGLLVAIAVVIIGLINIRRNNNKYLSEKSFEKMAQKATKDAMKKEKIISCDYCGSLIDITKDRVCPHCGAPYDQDEEFLNRNHVDKENQKLRYESYVETAKNKAKSANAKSVKAIKTVVIIFSAIILLLAAALIVENVSEHNVKKRDDKMAKDYVEMEYNIFDPVILDNDEITAAFTKFYKMDNDSYCLGVEINNKTDKELSFHLILKQLNFDSLYYSMYQDVAANTMVTQNLDFYTWEIPEDDDFNYFVVSDIYYYLEDSYNKDYLTKVFYTDAEKTTYFDESELELEEEKNDVRLYIADNDSYDCALCMSNIGEECYMVEFIDSYVNGQSFDGYYSDIYLVGGEQMVLDLYHYDFEDISEGPYNFKTSLLFTNINTRESFRIDNFEAVVRDYN